MCFLTTRNQHDELCIPSGCMNEALRTTRVRTLGALCSCVCLSIPGKSTWYRYASSSDAHRACSTGNGPSCEIKSKLVQYFSPVYKHGSIFMKLLQSLAPILAQGRRRGLVPLAFKFNPTQQQYNFLTLACPLFSDPYTWRRRGILYSTKTTIHIYIYCWYYRVLQSRCIRSIFDVFGDYCWCWCRCRCRREH